MMLVGTRVDCQELSIKKGFLSYKYFESDSLIAKSQFQSLLNSYPASERLLNKSKRNLLLGIAALGADIIIFERFKNAPYEVGDLGIIPNVLSLAIIIRFFLVSRVSVSRAVKKYNEQFDLGQLRLAPTKNGFGLVINF